MARFLHLRAIGFYLMFSYVVSWLQMIDGVAPMLMHHPIQI